MIRTPITTLLIPVQVDPSPAKPSSQLHVKLPSMLLHIAWSLHPPLFYLCELGCIFYLCVCVSVWLSAGWLEINMDEFSWNFVQWRHVWVSKSWLDFGGNLDHKVNVRIFREFLAYHWGIVCFTWRNEWTLLTKSKIRWWILNVSCYPVSRDDIGYLYRWIHLLRIRPYSGMYRHLYCRCIQLDHCILRCISEHYWSYYIDIIGERWACVSHYSSII